MWQWRSATMGTPGDLAQWIVGTTSFVRPWIRASEVPLSLCLSVSLSLSVSGRRSGQAGRTHRGRRGRFPRRRAREWTIIGGGQAFIAAPSGNTSTDDSLSSSPVRVVVPVTDRQRMRRGGTDERLDCGAYGTDLVRRTTTAALSASAWEWGRASRRRRRAEGERARTPRASRRCQVVLELARPKRRDS